MATRDTRSPRAAAVESLRTLAMADVRPGRWHLYLELTQPELPPEGRAELIAEAFDVPLALARGGGPALSLALERHRAAWAKQDVILDPRTARRPASAADVLRREDLLPAPPRRLKTQLNGEEVTVNLWPFTVRGYTRSHLAQVVTPRGPVLFNEFSALTFVHRHHEENFEVMVGPTELILADWMEGMHTLLGARTLPDGRREFAGGTLSSGDNDSDVTNVRLRLDLPRLVGECDYSYRG